MTVKITKPQINVREELNDLKKPTGVAGEAMLRAETVAEQQALIGVGRKNLIINGGFDVWQRGTTGSVVGGPNYASADRWKLYVNTSTTMTLSRQTFSPGQTEVPGNPKYYAKFDWLGTSASQFFGLEQFVEGCHHGAGDYLTISFYARTEHADDITLGVNQKFGSGGSADVNVGNFSVNAETTWKKFVITTQVPSISGKTVGTGDTLSFNFYRTGTLNSYLELANVQIELGKVATPFEHRSYGEELALCQRYYYDAGLQPVDLVGVGHSSGYSGVTSGRITFPVTMRVTPTFTRTVTQSNYSGNITTRQSPQAFHQISQNMGPGDFHYQNYFKFDAEL